MVSSKNVKVSQKRCLGTSIESFTGASPSEQIVKDEILYQFWAFHWVNLNELFLFKSPSSSSHS